MNKNNQMSQIIVFLILAFFSLNFSIQAQTLKDAFKNYFLIGGALNRSQIYEEDKKSRKIINEQFNTISPENVLKWALVHPQSDRYDFSDSDKFVELGLKKGMFIVGHTLIWHNQTPDWVFKDNQGNLVSRDELLKRMRDHIQTVVGRYKGKIRGWDVVNEAVSDEGGFRQSLWYKIIGEDFIAKAFQYAHEADPNAELYYNDYSLENELKRQTAIQIIKNLQKQKIHITGVGLQGHNSLTFPTLIQQEETITQFVELGIRVNITELDINLLPYPDGFSGAEVTRNFAFEEKLNPYKKGLPKDIQTKLADRYAELFKIFLKHHQQIDRVTFWNVTDGNSWLNNFPVRGRTNYPLLFDREGKEKPAFKSVIETALRFGK